MLDRVEIEMLKLKIFFLFLSFHTELGTFLVVHLALGLEIKITKSSLRLFLLLLFKTTRLIVFFLVEGLETSIALVLRRYLQYRSLSRKPPLC